MQHIAVVGGRKFTNYDLIVEELQQYMPFILVSGGAHGADSLAEKFADFNDLKKIIFLPDWKKFGRSAGYRRNAMIVERADLVIAFWDGASKGTKLTIDLAKEKGVPLRIVSY